MGRPRTRLRDIAEKTGYSANTVSLALRESPRIPEKTRELIRKVADELNYLPNRIAQSLVSQRSMTIGLILPDLTNPILMQVASEVSRVLAGQGYATMFATSHRSLADEKEVIAALRERQCDGILIFPVVHSQTDHLARLRANLYPIVSFAPFTMGELDSVASDDEAGADAATTHLVGQGRTRIALIDAAAPHGNLGKRAGYLAALQRAGISPDPALIHEVPGAGVNRGLEAMEAFAARGVRPDAVLATNDSLALGAELWCQQNGLTVPGDVALAGFDNIEFARLSPVPVTSVAYPVEVIVAAAVEKLRELIDAADKFPPATHQLIRPELLIRASSKA